MMNSALKLAEGWQAINGGNLALAEQIAGEVLQKNASLAEGWFLRGVAEQFRGDMAAAKISYEQSLQLFPSYVDPLNNLSVIYLQLRRPAEAASLCETYLRHHPFSPMANSNYANALVLLGRHDEAAHRYRLSLLHRPDHCDTLINFSDLLINTGQSQLAVAHLQHALQIRPDSSLAHSNLAVALINLNHFDAAEHHLSRALQIDPNCFESLNNLGGLLAKTKRFDQAVEILRKAIAIRPDSAMAHNNLGSALQSLQQSDGSLHHLQIALQLQPNLVSALCNLGKTYAELGRFEEAVAKLLEALSINPNLAEAHDILSMAYFHAGDDDKAARCLDDALRLDPNMMRAKVNRGFFFLRRGDFERGWPDFELRFAAREIHRRNASIPVWDGSDAPGKTILVTPEQGLGDVLQFVRFLPLVKAKVGRVICELPRALLPLVRRCQGADQFVAEGDAIPQVDLQISIMSLPHALKTIDAPEPHLVADPDLVQSWSDTLGKLPGLRIGIAWQGSRKFIFDFARSFALEYFEPVATIPGVTLVCLQKHVGLDQIEPNRSRVPVVELGPDFDERPGAFMDTAAVMKNLDLVITSDSAVAHLAGGLGVAVWTAIPFAADWRWFLDRDDSPWYPTMRLFRQTSPGDWRGVFDRIADAVRAELAQREAQALPLTRKGESRPGENNGRAASVCLVPTSPGDLLDKLSILRIKSQNISNPAQLANVRNELRALEVCRDDLVLKHGPLDHFVDQLEAVNAVLWQIEDEIRLCEKSQDFGSRFIELARSVYQQNDRRATLKRMINITLDSQFTEEKSHNLSDS